MLVETRGRGAEMVTGGASTSIAHPGSSIHCLGAVTSEPFSLGFSGPPEL